MSRKLQRKQIDLNLSEGRTGSTGTDDYGTINVSRLDDTDKMEDAFHKIELIIDKLAPATPPFLSDSNLELELVNFTTSPIGYVASARLADGITGPTVQNIFREAASYQIDVTGRPAGEPAINDGYAYDADSGTLTALLDAFDSPVITFTTADDSGTVTGGDGVLQLTINAERDYFDGIAGEEGFWNAFQSTVTIDPSVAGGLLDPGLASHQLDLTHSATGNQQYIFYVDGTSFPSLSGLSGTVDMTERVSGVPTVAQTDNIFGDFTVTNAIKNFYRDDFMSLEGASLTSADTLPSLRSQNDVVTSQLQVNALANQFRDNNIELEFTGRDAFGNETAQTVTLTDKRIDTSSITIAAADANVTSGRELSFGNTAVTTNTGGSGESGVTRVTYDHSISLKDVSYAEQLQVYGGVYRYPFSKDYSTYNFWNGSSNVAGPDYSNGIAEPTRWASFSFDLFTAQALTQQAIIDIAGNNGITTSNQLSGRCNLYYKVITWTGGAHGGSVLSESVWIEAIGNVNAATFAGGDPYMVGINSQTNVTVRTEPVNGAHIGTINENSRVLTVGNNITGTGTAVTVYVRIGINIGETFSFSGVSVSLN